MKLIVIDKSYLFGGPREQFAELFNTRTVIMTEALLYELLTTSLEQRVRCFSRIPPTYNPVLLVPNIGPILRWEVKNRKPLSDFNAVAINKTYRFNPGLVSEDFQLAPQQARDVENWRDDMKNWVREYAEHASSLTVRFPELNDYSPGGDAIEINRLKKRACHEKHFLESLYHRDEDGWPLFEEIDKAWAIYRWLQIRLLAALDHFKKYGKRESSGSLKTIENDYVDLEYCLVGCLCGALATRDGAMAHRFQALCPEGLLVQ